MKLATTFKRLIRNMRRTYQFKDMNMLQHGEAVHKAYLRLINQLEGGEKFIDLPP